MLSNCQGEESSVWLSFMLRYFCTPMFSLVERETSQYWLKYYLLTLMFINKSLLLPSFKLNSGACFSFPTFGSNVSFLCLRFSYVCSATLILALVTCLHDILSGGLYLTALILLVIYYFSTRTFVVSFHFFPALHSLDTTLFLFFFFFFFALCIGNHMISSAIWNK